MQLPKSKVYVFFSTMNAPDVAIDFLKSLKDTATVPHTLVVWDNGSPPDQQDKIRRLADVFIGSTHNWGVNRAIGTALLYLPYEFLITGSSSCKFNGNGWMDRILEPFDNPKVGHAASAYSNQHGYQFFHGYKPLSTEMLGEFDGLHTYRKKAIDEIGGICPAYGEWAFGDGYELSQRMRQAGWESAGVCAGLEHFPGSSVGTLPPEERRRIENRSISVYKHRKRHQFKKDWWSVGANVMQGAS